MTFLFFLRKNIIKHKSFFNYYFFFVKLIAPVPPEHIAKSHSAP
jgi:hypothetical protein